MHCTLTYLPQRANQQSHHNALHAHIPTPKSQSTKSSRRAWPSGLGRWLEGEPCLARCGISSILPDGRCELAARDASSLRWRGIVRYTFTCTGICSLSSEYVGSAREKEHWQKCWSLQNNPPNPLQSPQLPRMPSWRMSIAARIQAQVWLPPS